MMMMMKEIICGEKEAINASIMAIKCDGNHFLVTGQRVSMLACGYVDDDGDDDDDDDNDYDYDGDVR